MKCTEIIKLIEKRLKEITDVDDALQAEAFALFEELQNAQLAPNFSNSQNELISVVKNGVVVPGNLNRSRVEFLVEWTNEVVPILELLNETGKLPKNQPRDANFLEFVSKYLNDYINFITSHVHLEAIGVAAVTQISFLSSAIISSIEAFLSGEPHAAFSKLDMGLQHINSLLEYTSAMMGQNGQPTLYKMRTGGNTNYSADEMFHIPFEKRGLVKTNRYSIPGLPCVYLGNTPLICWEELGRPDLNNVQTSLFAPKEDIRYIDLSANPAFVRDYLKSVFTKNYGDPSATEPLSSLNTYLQIWPLIFVCSICVRQVNDAFKPEYIIPQMLLQWVRKSNYDGIAYFSTKIDHYSLCNNWIYTNYAFPVQTLTPNGHCSQLGSKFKVISEALPWQVYRAYRDAGSTYTMPYERGPETDIELYPNAPIRYAVTDFGRIQEFFDRKFSHEIAGYGGR
ncbi:hypothetical protein QNH28_03470 [Paenibacillus sp. G2S3]|uniref:hypothetical protein n=1 Tax=Paenibacillus sp. G2S3 TaxID=3047872 RepID=UPI0024C179D2|nr:hypothetical protein [Paenibacillus sp. G2S3]WHY20094.1 hypothetical protein QNH28_03470 [Paenibacillus sp. G2S3]